jgi:hypothetical protein
MADGTKLDGDFWGPGRPTRPSNGGGVLPVGGMTHDPEGNRIVGGDRLQPVPESSVGTGIDPRDKNSSPEDTR